MEPVSISGEVNSFQHDMVLSIGGLCSRHNMSRDMVIAGIFKSVVTEKSPLGKLLQFAIDEAADQFVSEELYQRHAGLLDFLASCGCDDEEVQFKSYVQNHPDIFTCKAPGCPGKIVGGCPKMYCEFCGKQYYVDVEGITKAMCGRCVSDHIRECDEKSRRRRHQVFAVRSLN